MGLYSRLYSFVNGTPNNGDEVDAEFDAVATVLNGGIENANIATGAAIVSTKLAAIPPTKINSYASGDYLTIASPGDTESLSEPTDLVGELQRLRYRIKADAGMTSVKYFDSAGVEQSMGWVEPRIVGRNLFPNNGFEVKTSAVATDPPDGWTAEGTPDGLTISSTTAVTLGANKRSLLINGRAGASGDGVTYTLTGLKASTKYLIGMAYVRVSGTVRLSTTGGASGVDYQNFSLTDNSTSAAAYLQGVVMTTAVPASVVVKLDGSANNTDYRVYQVWCYEVSDQSTLDIPVIPTQTATDSTSDTVPATFTSSQWNWETHTPLSLSQYVPCLGYRLTYEVQLSVLSAGTANDVHKHAFRLQLDSGGGVNTVAGPYIKYENSDGTGTPEVGGIVSLKYVVDNPTPGSTYYLTTQIGAYNGGGDHSQVTINPLLESLQSTSTARLSLERM